MIRPITLLSGLLLPVFAACSADPPDKGNDAPAAPLAQASEHDWPRFFGPAGDGISRETGLLDRWPAGGPPVLWKLETGESYAAPVIARGRLVHQHRIGAEELIDCLDAGTGKRFWRAKIPCDYRPQYGDGDGSRSTPCIAGTRVYALGLGGELHCWELETGKPVWKRTLADDYPSPPRFFGFGVSPVVEGDHVLINVGGSESKGVVAFHKDTGKTVWSALDTEASYSTPVTATVGGKRRAFFLTRSGAACLNPIDGAVIWNVPFRARLHASIHGALPVVAGDLAFFSSSYGVGGVAFQVTADDKKELWRGQSMSSHFSTCVHKDGLLYGFDGRFDGGGGSLRCVDLKTGEMKWQDGDYARGALIVADGRFYIRVENEVLLAELTPKGVTVVGKFAGVRAPPWTAPALAGGRLYVRDEKTIVCLDVRAKK